MCSCEQDGAFHVILLLKLNSAISTHYLPAGRLPELGNVSHLLREGEKPLWVHLGSHVRPLGGVKGSSCGMARSVTGGGIIPGVKCYEWQRPPATCKFKKRLPDLGSEGQKRARVRRIPGAPLAWARAGCVPAPQPGAGALCNPALGRCRGCRAESAEALLTLL